MLRGLRSKKLLVDSRVALPRQHDETLLRQAQLLAGQRNSGVSSTELCIDRLRRQAMLPDLLAWSAPHEFLIAWLNLALRRIRARPCSWPPEFTFLRYLTANDRHKKPEGIGEEAQIDQK